MALGGIFGGLGPIGSLIRNVAGHLGGDSSTENDELSAEKVFLVALFGMLGKLAKADGIVTPDEVEVVRDFLVRMKFPKKNSEYAADIFNKAKDAEFTFQDVAEQFAEYASEDYQLKILAADILFNLAAADGLFHSSEEEMLLSMKSIFGLSNSEFNSIKSRYFDAEEDVYAVLNCTSESTNDEIKKSYKKLVSDFHPDKVIAKGLPKEFIEFAEKRFMEIKDAYEKIRVTREL